MKTIQELLISAWPCARMTDTFGVIGMDSLEYLGFLTDVEDALDVTLPRSPGFKTPQDIADWLAAPADRVGKQ
jgi:acyl carrier protein